MFGSITRTVVHARSTSTRILFNIAAARTGETSFCVRTSRTRVLRTLPYPDTASHHRFSTLSAAAAAASNRSLFTSDPSSSYSPRALLRHRALSTSPSTLSSSLEVDPPTDSTVSSGTPRRHPAPKLVGLAGDASAYALTDHNVPVQLVSRLLRKPSPSDSTTAGADLDGPEAADGHSHRVTQQRSFSPTQPREVSSQLLSHSGRRARSTPKNHFTCFQDLAKCTLTDLVLLGPAGVRRLLENTLQRTKHSDGSEKLPYFSQDAQTTIRLLSYNLDQFSPAERDEMVSALVEPLLDERSSFLCGQGFRMARTIAEHKIPIQSTLVDKLYSRLPVHSKKECDWLLLIAGATGRETVVKYLLKRYHTLYQQHGADAQSYYWLIRGYSLSDREKEVFSTLQMMEENNVKPTSDIYAEVLDVLIRKGKLDAALELFRSLQESNVRVCRRCWTRILVGLVNDGRVDETLNVFVEFEESGLDSDEPLLTSLLSRASRLPQSRQLVSRLFKAAKRLTEDSSARNTNVRLWTAVINAMARVGDINEVIPLMTHLSQRGLRFDAYGYNAVISGLVRQRHMSAAQSIYDQMRHHKVPVDMRTFSAMIRGWAQERDSKRAMHVFADLIDAGLQPNSFIYAALISSLSYSGKLGDARALFDSLESPNEFLYSSMINAYAHHSKPEGTRELFGKMVACGITPTDVSYRALLRGHVNDPPAALRIWQEMEHRQLVSPRDWQYRALIAINSKDPKEVLACLELFKQQPPLSVDAVSYGALLSGILFHEGFERGFLETNEAMKSGVPCDAVLWAPVLYKMLEIDLDAAYTLIHKLVVKYRLRLDKQLRERIQWACKRNRSSLSPWMSIPGFRTPSNASAASDLTADSLRLVESF